jgi:hypothetical protein
LAVTVLVVSSAILGWILVREVLLAKIRSRAIVLVRLAVALVVFGAGGVSWAVWPSRARTYAAIAVGLGAAAFAAGMWLVVGCSKQTILRQGELVARGLLLKVDRRDHQLMVDSPRMRVRVVGGFDKVYVVQVFTGRRSKKGVLFQKGLRTFLGSSPRSERGGHVARS